MKTTDLGKPQPASALLNIYCQPDGTFWVMDSQGPLCIANSPEELLPLLAAECQSYPDPVRRAHLKLGAREVLFPGQGEAREAEILARHATQRKAREKELELARGNVSLESLGLV